MNKIIINLKSACTDLNTVCADENALCKYFITTFSLP